MDGRADAAADAVIEVHLKPGVMDPVAESTERAIRDMGIELAWASTARRYELHGQVSAEQSETIARRLLANAVIEDVHFRSYTPPEHPPAGYKLRIIEVPILRPGRRGAAAAQPRGRPFPQPHGDAHDC